MIIVDYREPDEIVEKLRDKKIEVRKETLEVGDYLLPKGVGIERKHGDFMTSIQSKRIFKQLSDLSRYNHPILAITCPNKWKILYQSARTARFPRAFDKSLYGFLLSCVCGFNIPVLTFEGDDEFVDFLVVAHKKLTSGKAKTKKIKKIKAKGISTEERKKRLVAQLKGVGYEKAKRLLEKFNSVVNIGKAPLKDIIDIDGIGKKTGKSIKEELN